ncbi:MAG TPA: ATP-binding protein [Acidimicrobiales bacterium]
MSERSPERAGGRDDAVPPSVDQLLLSLVSDIEGYAMFVLDPDGRVTTWNRGAERLKGFRASEIIGRHFSCFYTADDVREGLPDRTLAEARQRGRYENEGWRVRKDGSQFWANVVVVPLRGESGEIIGYGKVTCDLTERKRNYDAMARRLEDERRAAARLRELDRMKNELVEIVAHDLRAPVGLIHGFANLLLSDWHSMPDIERLDLVRRMHQRAHVLANLVDKILDVARIEAGQLVVDRVPIDLRSIVDRVVLDSDVPPSRLRVRVDEPLPLALGDEHRTWQVLSNLVSNALKYSPHDTQVEIGVDVSTDSCVVSVADQGPGIALERQPLLFERFTRIPETACAPGTGLGLYIAKSLVEAQGGRIWVDSKPEAGATFAFTLPLAPSSRP